MNPQTENPFKPGFGETPQAEPVVEGRKNTNEGIAEDGDRIGAGIVADKELRRDLDAQLQKLKSLLPSRERALSITKLQEAIMWLGMDLKRLSDTRPYPSSYDPSTTKVEPTADGLKL